MTAVLRVTMIVETVPAEVVPTTDLYHQFDVVHLPAHEVISIAMAAVQRIQAAPAVLK